MNNNQTYIDKTRAIINLIDGYHDDGSAFINRLKRMSSEAKSLLPKDLSDEDQRSYDAMASMFRN